MSGRSGGKVTFSGEFKGAGGEERDRMGGEGAVGGGGEGEG